MPFPSVSVDVDPTTGDPALYVGGVFLPVTEAVLEPDGDVTVRIDSRYVTAVRGIYAPARHNLPTDAG